MSKNSVLASLILSIVLNAPLTGATWTIEKVTDNTESDLYPFIVCVQSGLLIAYTNHDPDDELFVANNFSGSWTSNRVTDNTRDDFGYDITAKYGEQTAHISVYWQDAPDDEISYYKGSATTWSTERVTDNGDNDQRPAIALDNSGHVHMVYQRGVGGDAEIFYANNVSGSWIAEQVTDNGTDDLYPWFSLDKTGNPNIIYVNGASLHYTKKTVGIWTSSEHVAGGMGINSFPFIVLDKDDKAHVTFAKNDGSFNQVYYANNVTGTWQESKVTNASYDNIFPTIFVDPYSKVHIAYEAAEPGDIEMFYASNAAGIWTTGRVTDNGTNDAVRLGRFFISDAQGIGHMVFVNASDGDAEIYHAYSNEPLYAGVEESPSISLAPTLSVAPIISRNSAVYYMVPVSGNVSLKVYDASGSLVKTLVSGTQSAGDYIANWNGITDAGSRATGGVYFFRLVTNDEAVSVKTILK